MKNRSDVGRRHRKVTGSIPQQSPWCTGSELL